MKVTSISSKVTTQTTKAGWRQEFGQDVVEPHRLKYKRMSK